MHKSGALISMLVFLLCGTFSCSKSKTPPLPEEIYDEEKMTALLTGLQIADAAYQNGMLPPMYDGRPKQLLFDFCVAHQADTALFSKSLKYYTSQPALLEDIYAKVVSNLNELKQQSPKQDAP